jgi:hypothetical protein
MKSTLKLVAVLVVLFAGILQTKAETMTMEVQRVFMHKPGEYSVMYTNTDQDATVEILNRGDRKPGGEYWDWVLKNHWSDWNGVKVTEKLKVDVAPGKPMYIKVTGSGNSVTVEIHIHSVSEVNGGDWSEGTKYQKSYRTEVVE